MSFYKVIVAKQKLQNISTETFGKRQKMSIKFCHQPSYLMENFLKIHGKILVLIFQIFEIKKIGTLIEKIIINTKFGNFFDNF